MKTSISSWRLVGLVIVLTVFGVALICLSSIWWAKSPNGTLGNTLFDAGREVGGAIVAGAVVGFLVLASQKQIDDARVHREECREGRLVAREHRREKRQIKREEEREEREKKLKATQHAEAAQSAWQRDVSIRLLSHVRGPCVPALASWRDEIGSSVEPRRKSRRDLTITDRTDAVDEAATPLFGWLAVLADEPLQHAFSDWLSVRQQLAQLPTVDPAPTQNGFPEDPMTSPALQLEADACRSWLVGEATAWADFERQVVLFCRELGKD